MNNGGKNNISWIKPEYTALKSITTWIHSYYKTKINNKINENYELWYIDWMMVYHFNIVNSIIVDVLLIIGLILLIYAFLVARLRR